MVRVSGPLMINHLLATIFWRIDVWILFPLAGAAAVGLYSIGLKYIDGLNIIPSGLDHGHLPADEPAGARASRTACCAPTWSACAC
jgi:O-antigen/teichoic acid export membrane protein